MRVSRSVQSPGSTNYRADLDLGVVVMKPALELTKEDYSSQMDANLWGSFTCAQAAAL